MSKGGLPSYAQLRPPPREQRTGTRVRQAGVMCLRSRITMLRGDHRTACAFLAPLKHQQPSTRPLINPSHAHTHTSDPSYVYIPSGAKEELQTNSKTEKTQVFRVQPATLLLYAGCRPRTATTTCTSPSRGQAMEPRHPRQPRACATRVLRSTRRVSRQQWAGAAARSARQRAATRSCGRRRLGPRRLRRRRRDSALALRAAEVAGALATTWTEHWTVIEMLDPTVGAGVGGQLLQLLPWRAIHVDTRGGEGG